MEMFLNKSNPHAVINTCYTNIDTENIKKQDQKKEI